MAARTLNIIDIFLRTTAGILGGYGFTFGFTALGIVTLVGMNVDYHAAETGMQLLAFLIFLAIFIWSFAAASIIRLWIVLAGGGAAMAAAAWAIQRAALA